MKMVTDIPEQDQHCERGYWPGVIKKNEVLFGVPETTKTIHINQRTLIGKTPQQMKQRHRKADTLNHYLQ